MPYTVMFVKPEGDPSRGVPFAILRVRAMQVIALDATTSILAEAGDYIIVGNGEADMIRFAKGTVPNADATAESSATTAGMTVPAGSNSDPVKAVAGDKVQIKAND